MGTGPTILPGNRLPEYLRGLVHNALAVQDVQVGDTTEYYLVNLLTEFERTEKLFIRQEGHFEEEPLALTFGRAMSSRDLTTRIRSLKRLGDTALYVAGFFGDHVERRINPDYYIEMGEGAYSSLASILAYQEIFAQIYHELSATFPELVSVLKEIGTTTPQSNLELLKIYERWLKSGDDNLKSILEEEGLIISKGRH